MRVLAAAPVRLWCARARREPEERADPSRRAVALRQRPHDGLMAWTLGNGKVLDGDGVGDGRGKRQASSDMSEVDGGENTK